MLSRRFWRWNSIKICVWTCNMTLARWTQPSGPLCLCQCFSIPPHLLINSLTYNTLKILTNWFLVVTELTPEGDFSTASEFPTVISSSRSSKPSESSFPCLEWHDGFGHWPSCEKVHMCWKIADIFLFCNHHCPQCGICPNRPVLVFLKAFIPSMSLIIYIRYDRSSILYAFSLVGARTFSLKCLPTFPPGL